jgi:ubiquinone/menaquinone biosynthesis C-methylase UbiE
VFPMPHRLRTEELHDFMEIVGNVKGKKLLELGCGAGKLTVFLSKLGANVTAIDIGFDLVYASHTLAKVNHADCQFQQATIKHLPFHANTFDIVIGLAVLHHLSEDEVTDVVEEAYRVLKDDGVAVFYETIENSKTFDYLQKLLPAGKRTSQYYRPSMLQRKAWRTYLASLDEREMMTKEFIEAGKKFRDMKIHPYGFLIRLERLIGKRYNSVLTCIDRMLFATFPRLQNLCRFVLVEYHK